MIAQLNSCWTVRVDRDELVEFQVDGTHGSAVAGLRRLPHPAPRRHPQAGLEPRPRRPPTTSATDWLEVPDNDEFDNGFKLQWEQFIRHVVEDAPHEFDFLAGARGVRLAEAGLASSRTGARVELPELAMPDAVGSAPAQAADTTDGVERGLCDDHRHFARRSRTTARWELAEAPALTRPSTPLRLRVAYAAAHVIPRVGAENVPGAPADIDWDATLAFRHHIWSWGLGVADAMDTAQRNMGLDPKATRELIVRSAAEARSVGRAGSRGEHRPPRRRDGAAAGSDRRLRRAAAFRRRPRRGHRADGQPSPGPCRRVTS